MNDDPDSYERFFSKGLFTLVKVLIFSGFLASDYYRKIDLLKRYILIFIAVLKPACRFNACRLLHGETICRSDAFTLRNTIFCSIQF